MTPLARPRPLDRFTQIGDLAGSVRWFVHRSLAPLAVVLAAEMAILIATGSPGAACFSLLSVATCLILAVWRPVGRGLPILPLLAFQNLIVYGLPIVIGHEVITSYPESFVTRAGLEVLIFSGCLACSWRLALELFHPAPALCYALQGFRQEGEARLIRLGFTLAIGSSAYLLLQSLGLLDPLFSVLPDGSYSLASPLISAAATCGFFLVSMHVGTGRVPVGRRLLFWTLLAGNCFISAAGFLLSATTALLASVLIGLFWSTGRMPWRYLAVVVALLSFLNLGKFTMRERYWGTEGEVLNQVTLTQMPRYYAEWFQASYEAIAPGDAGPSVNDDRAHAKGQNLLERVNNLQNLLFVIDAIDNGHIPPLHGATYELIPPLLVPRIFWPEKPRTHEGQVLLNVHFGRQELTSTFQTYIAWGLLPEAYGNFGATAGSVFLGVVLGVMFAWLESFTARKLLVSLEGFVSFTILLGMMGSFEMVASVLVTSVFQSIIVLVAASLPFVERTVLKRPGT